MAGKGPGIMNHTSLAKLWQRIQQALDQGIQQALSAGRSGAWVRFFLLPTLAVLLFLLSRQLGGILEWFIDLFWIEPDGTAWSPQTFYDWILRTLFGVGMLEAPRAPVWARLVNLWTEIGGENIQLALLGGLTFWVAYRLISGYVYYLYRMNDFRQAKHMISSVFIPFRRRKAVITKGKEIIGKSISIHEMYGGQITLNMDAHDGYAAALERADHSIRIVGPQDRFPVMLDGFMHLRKIFDLRDQRVQVTVRARTRDGIPVMAQHVMFICRISGINKSTRNQRYEYCDPEVIQTLLYQHWVGADWEKPAKRRKALHDLVSTALNEFIAEHTLVEILPETNEFGPVCQLSQNNASLFQQFTADFERYSGKHGLELIWTGRGEWRIDELVNPEVIKQNCSLAAENWLQSQTSIAHHASIDVRNQEVRRLVQHLLGLFTEARKSDQTKNETILRLGRIYLERLQFAFRIMESRGESPPDDWDAVAKHLERFIN
jgi:hypothetical protein